MKRLIKSLKQSLKEMQQIRKGEMKATSWDDFIVEVESEETELLTLNANSLDYYRRFVNGNIDIPEDQAKRKMTRNMLLAFPYKKDSDVKKHPRVWYTYGSLRFIVKNNEVTWIVNHKPVFKAWSKDWDEYNRLNKDLGIDKKYIK